MSQSDWMAAYQDRTLGEMHMPGSHDAGTTKNYIDKTAFGTDSNAATQDLTIAEQLEAGTRFFDLRLTEHKKKIVPHHTTAGQGAFGTTSVDTILEQAADFCLSHATEVVIFRISHTAHSTRAHEIAKASGKGKLHTGTGNLCTKTLRKIVSEGGGLVCIFDHEKFGLEIAQDKGIHSYRKYTDSKPTNDDGISTCGCYSATHKLQEVVRNGLKGQYEHNEWHVTSLHSHLWQVYWQKTYVNPVSNTGIERGTTSDAFYKFKDRKVHGGTHAATSYMIGLMKGMGPLRREDFAVEEEESHKHPILRTKVVTKDAVMFSTLSVRNYCLPNIISYDFVNEHVNKKIISLNTKNLQAASDDADQG